MATLNLLNCNVASLEQFISHGHTPGLTFGFFRRFSLQPLTVKPNMAGTLTMNKSKADSTIKECVKCKCKYFERRCLSSPGSCILLNDEPSLAFDRLGCSQPLLLFQREVTRRKLRAHQGRARLPFCARAKISCYSSQFHGDVIAAESIFGHRPLSTCIVVERGKKKLES